MRSRPRARSARCAWRPTPPPRSANGTAPAAASTTPSPRSTQGFELAEEIVERELLADALVWRAEVALLQDDLPAARELLARAQAEGQRVGSNASLASVDRALGRLHLVDGAGARAVDHFEAALHRAGDGWGPDQRAETLYWLGTAYLDLQPRPAGAAAIWSRRSPSPRRPTCPRCWPARPPRIRGCCSLAASSA